MLVRELENNEALVKSYKKFGKHLLLYKDGKLYRFGKEVPTTLDRDGYKMVTLGGKSFREHRVVWFMHHGTWPKGQVDHINQDKQDNRIENLRDVPSAKNLHNISPPNKNNATGIRGVTKRPDGSYIARINIDGKPILLGRYKTAEEAEKAYLDAKENYLKEEQDDQPDAT